MPSSDPISTLQAIPGAYIQARVQRTGLTLSETLIREEAGDRGALNAIIHAWLPASAARVRAAPPAVRVQGEERAARVSLRDGLSGLRDADLDGHPAAILITVGLRS